MTSITKEEKIENKKRRLLLLILLLACTMVLSISATFAWFTSNRVVTVDDLQVNVTAVNGLQISADAENWKTRIDKDDLINNRGENFNQLPSVLSNVSSAGEFGTDGHLKIFYGDIQECDGDDCYLLNTSPASTTSACYDKTFSGSPADNDDDKCKDNVYLMAFNIYLKLDGEFADSVDLRLTQNAGVRSIGKRDMGIQNTARIAFIEEGFVDKDTYLDGDGETSGIDLIKSKMNTAGGNAIIWEPNYNAHTQAGYANAAKYNIEADGTSKFVYKGVKASTTGVPLYNTNDAAYGDYFAIPSRLISTSSSGEERSTTIKLNVGVTKLRVYFWVEGQDVDTQNEAAGTDMQLNLEFSIPE
ncbi:MAG: hypothetical protein K2H20_02020 [Bacilli bacterium]|nr:hypothetical protein [Bacilli bacterium]